MNVLVIILCAVSLTAVVFLIARLGIKKREDREFVDDNKKL